MANVDFVDEKVSFSVGKLLGIAKDDDSGRGVVSICPCFRFVGTNTSHGVTSDK